MKLLVQIPCLNEEQTLPAVITSIPKQIPGIDVIEILVIDDGSTDRTVEVAQQLGVKHIVRHTRNMGLARSFRDGIDYAMAQGADIVVNTDGDNQYPQERIADLVQPIIHGTADIVIGDRQTATIAHFSPFKKRMQAFGSGVVNRAAGTKLPDAASGFRAYSRASLFRLNIITQFSYCMETIIQAGNRRLRIASVPIETNAKTRESRLFKNIWHHMFKSAAAIVRSTLMFRPYTILTTLGFVCLIAGLVPFVRFAFFAFTGRSDGHIQSLILGSSILIASLFCFALLVIVDLLRTNRILVEETLERIKHMQYPTPASEHGFDPMELHAEQYQVVSPVVRPRSVTAALSEANGMPAQHLTGREAR
ncbi:glycosyltransferase family 2 protein [Nakamurella endophytica]|uniref:Glycosyl transferase n=1 Tax=Nakamurella endophytica TaxID=1748367 RepID=A0A917WEA6_9ACTN|nr:glycosyltransferase family 2 protein [Nakamurella endophytica]GGL99384.1 glycosyl transferase [Nakamurella endophytica]